jgi:hypothetical protein
MTDTDLPPDPPAVVPAAEDDPVLQHWRRHYAPLVAKAGPGTPTALRVTLGWATSEVAYAHQVGEDPRVNMPPH